MRTVLTVLGTLVCAGLAAAGGALLFAYSGIYNIAATEPHTPPVRWFLEVGMRESVQTQASGIDAPPLESEALAVRGMRQFEAMCVPCHGAPGQPRQPVGEGLKPHAPELSGTGGKWSDQELFWIVAAGLKMTGMPAWSPTHRDDEIWAMVAFIRRLERMDAGAWQQATALPLPPSSGESIALAGPAGQSALACARCHGLDGLGHPSGAFPKLAGQGAAYLLKALNDYAGGARPSGLMQPLATALSEAERAAVARYYAGLPRGEVAAEPDPRLLQQGGALAAIGNAAGTVRACADCHGRQGEGDGMVPALAAQYADYSALQLHLWKIGARGEVPEAAPMRDIAARLSEAEIAAVAAYYAALPPAQRSAMR